MKKVLVLCTGNSCRSQIAEGYIRHFAGSKAEVYSAGVEHMASTLKPLKLWPKMGLTSPPIPRTT